MVEFSVVMLSSLFQEGKENSEQIVANLLSKTDAQALYASIRLNSISKLRQLLESSEERREDLLEYIQKVRFPPLSSTFLHVAARRGTVEVLEVSVHVLC